MSTEAYSLGRTGDIKVRLVTVQLTDVKANTSMDDAIAAVQGTSAYWQRMSNGRLSMSVASTETFNSSKAWSGQRYSDMMDTIANELGWAPSPYTALVVFVSAPTLSDGAYGAGWSYNGTSGRVIMPRPASLTKSVLAHEFGHVLGLMHANSLECASGAQDVSTNADGTFTDSSCSVREYGDTMDLMGVSQTSQPTISSTLWEYGGFGTGREVRNLGKVENTSNHTLTAWAGAADNRALKFTDPGSGEVYYLELRLPVGFDTATAVLGNRGVKIVQQIGAGSLILMPDSRRFASYYSPKHAWQAGQAFTTHAGTRVIINWISDSAASVTIEPPSGAAAKAMTDLASSTNVLGTATSGVTCGLRDGGCYQMFANGAAIWSPATGAQASLYGPVRDAWARSGFENGPLGYPTSGPICGIRDNGCYQAYQNGEILYSPASGAQPTTAGAIRTAYRNAGAENSALGYPTSAELCGIRNAGCYQTYQHGEILWSPATGARISRSGGIRTLYRNNGAENGLLGYPTTDEICGLVNGGCYQAYQNGEILWSPATGARISRSGGIRTLYRNNGAENGLLGYPTTDEICGLTKGGCYQNYQNGAIIWSPTTGAQLSPKGPIRTLWQQNRFETGPLAYPTSAVVCGLVKGGCYQNYQNGAIIWSPTTGAQLSPNGPIRTLWQQNRFETGPLAYPTGPQTCNTTGTSCTQPFTGGKITWTPTRGAYIN
ncbi:M43 family zinc metalloprotease [Arthrobacter sp. B3I9]|uniref:M43 family zinc metalloprotease n=1 Tax=Arthrobacter sp. B3I9 TaxID=3042270 RepID=UPI0027D811E7|nr:M43 family zinc metalloprotease [Arthrobacter sp. B3I9]